MHAWVPAVDTMGLLLVVVVHCAGIQDYHGAKLVLMKLQTRADEAANSC